MPTVYHDDGRSRVVPAHAVARMKGEGWHERPARAPRQVTPPDENALKAGWVDFAVSQGMDRDQAEAMTKVQLKERFGG